MIDVIGLLVIFFCVAFIFNEGLWSAALAMINMLLAGIIAVNFFEPVANWLDGMFPSLTYFWDFLSAWLVFAIALVVLRLATNYLSKHRARFKRPVDLAGGAFFALVTGYLMMGFIFFTLHLAPLGRNFLGFQKDPDSRMVFGLGPDRAWLGLMRNLSEGSLSRPDVTQHTFTTQEDFILKYGQRRKQYESQSLTVSK
jgi:uncharacterized membrane protein required for colicin V production